MLRCTLGHCRGRQKNNWKSRNTTGNIASTRAMHRECFRCSSRRCVVVFCSHCMIAEDFLGRRNAMKNVLWFFDKLDDFVRGFAESPHQKDALYPDKVKQWFRFTRVSSEHLLHMRRINPTSQRMDITKLAVRIKVYHTVAWSLMMRDTDLEYGGNFFECLEFIHTVLFSELETAMGRVAEALIIFEEKCK